MKSIKVIAALALVVLLGVFGIANIGGDTWVTASAPLAPGWMRNPSPLAPRPPESSVGLWVMLVFALVAITIFDAIVRSPITSISQEEEDADDTSGATQP